MQYRFEWDLDKAANNRKKHGIRFEEAAKVFLDDRAVTVFDDEHSEVEDCWVTLGLNAAGKLLVVCHAFRNETRQSAVVRIFSSRKATKTERQQYENSR